MVIRKRLRESIGFIHTGRSLDFACEDETPRVRVANREIDCMTRRHGHDETAF